MAARLSSAGKASKIATPPTITKIVAKKADFMVSVLPIRHLRDEVLKNQGKSPTGYVVHFKRSTLLRKIYAVVGAQRS